jgi:hypothetical protein
MNATTGVRPAAADYAPFYAGYVALVPEDDILALLAAQAAAVHALAARVPPDRESFRYEPGKWSIRQVVGHITDVERVFGYRAFCIARGEASSLPGFDEQAYMAEANYDARALAGLVDEFAAVRAANLAVLAHLSPEAWRRRGTANGTPVTVLALAFLLAGHCRHHLGVLASRYGLGTP